MIALFTNVEIQFKGCFSQNVNMPDFFTNNKKFVYLNNSNASQKEGFAVVESIVDNFISLSVVGALYSSDVVSSNKEQSISSKLRIKYKNSKYYLQLPKGEIEGFLRKDQKSLIFVLEDSSIELIVANNF